MLVCATVVSQTVSFMCWFRPTRIREKTAYVDDERAQHRHASEHDSNVVLGMVECVSDCVCPVCYILFVQLMVEFLGEARDPYSRGTVLHSVSIPNWPDSKRKLALT